MHILITGAAGMIGRKLTERLVRDGTLGGRPVTSLTLHDVVPRRRRSAAVTQFRGQYGEQRQNREEPAWRAAEKSKRRSRAGQENLTSSPNAEKRRCVDASRSLHG